MPFLNYNSALKVVRIDTGAYYATIITSCSLMIEQVFESKIVASTDNSGYNNPSKSKCCKLF